LVRLDLSPGVRGRVVDLTPTIRRLDVGVEDSARFLAKVHANR
jgi:hypothetical protein